MLVFRRSVDQGLRIGNAILWVDSITSEGVELCIETEEVIRVRRGEDPLTAQIEVLPDEGSSELGPSRG